MATKRTLEKSATCPECKQKFTPQGLPGHRSRKHGVGDALPERPPPDRTGKGKRQKLAARKSSPATSHPSSKAPTLESSAPKTSGLLDWL